MWAVGKFSANLRVVSPLCAPTSHISFTGEVESPSRSCVRSIPLGRIEKADAIELEEAYVESLDGSFLDNTFFTF